MLPFNKLSLYLQNLQESQSSVYLESGRRLNHSRTLATQTNNLYPYRDYTDKHCARNTNTPKVRRLLHWPSRSLACAKRNAGKSRHSDPKTYSGGSMNWIFGSYVAIGIFIFIFLWKKFDIEWQQEATDTKLFMIAVPLFWPLSLLLVGWLWLRGG
jgi:hypothetical protein